MLAPIVLFTYNRFKHTKQTVEALQRNELAKGSELYVFCDGPKANATEEQRAKVYEVQEYVKTITGFKNVFIKVQKTNKGLANSVIAGVTEIIERFGKVIVVEDDIITHPFFLRFMNDCLETYQDRNDIFMIGGYNINIRIPKNYNEDVYVVHRSCTWGWATWKDRWKCADWCVSDYQSLVNNTSLQDIFNRGGKDMFPMLQMQMDGKIDSWGIRWDYSMFKHNALCVRPIKSLCDNSGLDGSGVHCGVSPKGFTAMIYKEPTYSIKIPKNISLNRLLAKRFADFYETWGMQLPTFGERMKAKFQLFFEKIFYNT